MRILLIEDDEKLADRTAEYLRDHDAVVDVEADGEQGLRRASKNEHDVVLLDIMLPGIDGLEVCRRLRQVSSLPVIMVSARGEEIDKVVGLELGADDYLAKPFSPRELLARVRAVLRRKGPANSESNLASAGRLSIDRDRHVASLGGEPIELTAYQFDLLWLLVSQSERVLSRVQLHNQVRDMRGEPPAEFDPSVDRSIDVHMSKVRQALDTVQEGASSMIKTVRGVGYVFDPAGGG